MLGSLDTTLKAMANVSSPSPMGYLGLFLLSMIDEFSQFSAEAYG